MWGYLRVVYSGSTRQINLARRFEASSHSDWIGCGECSQTVSIGFPQGSGDDKGIPFQSQNSSRHSRLHRHLGLDGGRRVSGFKSPAAHQPGSGPPSAQSSCLHTNHVPLGALGAAPTSRIPCSVVQECLIPPIGAPFTAVQLMLSSSSTSTKPIVQTFSPRTI